MYMSCRGRAVRARTSIPEVPGASPGPAVAPLGKRFILIA